MLIGRAPVVDPARVPNYPVRAKPVAAKFPGRDCPICRKLLFDLPVGQDPEYRWMVKTPEPDRPDGEGGTSGTGDLSGTAGDSSQEGRDDLTDRVAHFLALLSDDDEITRVKAAEALGRIGDPAAAGALIDTLWDDDARVRLKAAWALGEIGDPRAAPALRRLYRMEREEAREIIKEALDAINRQAGSG